MGALGLARRSSPPVPEIDLACLDITRLPVLRAPALFELLDQRGRLAAIKRLTALPDAYWNVLCLPVIHAYAERVQLLPASVAHHHPGPGGLLVHTLEVVEFALRRRKSHSLPQGAPIEVVARLEHLYTYGIFLAALLHDVGKPAANFELRLLDSPSGSKSRPWSPLGRPITHEGATHYAFTYRKAPYTLHMHVGPMMYGVLVPAAGRAWLGRERALLEQLAAWLYGDTFNAGVLGEIVHHADRASTAESFRHGVQSRFPSAPEPPLAERLLDTLRQLLAEGRFKLNRNGGGGWSTASELFLVCVPAAQAMIARLRELGVTVPDDNQRIFDALQEARFVVPTPEDAAIWRVRVTGEGYQHTFTMLRFPLSRLFPFGDYPEPFVGTLEPVEKETARVAMHPERSVSETFPAETSAVRDPVIKAPKPTELKEETLLAAPLAEVDELADLGASALASVEFDASPLDEDRESRAGEGVADVPPGEIDLPEPPTTAPRSGNPSEKAIRALPLPEGLTDNGQAFLAWLSARLDGLEPDGDGISYGGGTVNNRAAMVHLVQEGMLLASPRIFHAAADELAGEIKFTALQTGLKKSGLIETHQPGNRNVLFYEVRKGGRKVSQLRGMVIQEPGRLFQNLPRPNPLLHRAEEPA
ncbi:MobH family relaxase [Endothiovibrio diazotrophicus]